MSFKRVVEIAENVGMNIYWKQGGFVFEGAWGGPDAEVKDKEWGYAKMNDHGGGLWKGWYRIEQYGQKNTHHFEGGKAEVANWLAQNYIMEMCPPERDRPSVHHQTYLFDPAVMISIATLGGFVGACILIVAIVKASFAFAA